MPNYIFDCSGCHQQRNIGMSISEYMEMRDSGFYCTCGEKLTQRFGFLSSSIKKGSQEMMEEIKEEARAIVKKISDGDVQTVREIYGEEQNKLKQDYLNPGYQPQQASSPVFKRSG